MDRTRARLRPGARVLEIGSGPGRDALALEERGLSVRRTDITPAFVDRLRRLGQAADVLDPLHEDLRDPEAGPQAGPQGGPQAGADGCYDAVWADAVLLHVARADLPRLLRRLHDAVRDGGVLALTMKEGDGDGWSSHGSVGAPRHFTFWREPALRAVLEGAGWRILHVHRSAGRPGIEEGWLAVLSERSGTVVAGGSVA
ncbi:class I SAM-dependent methyltransferase [Nocardioides sp. HDW12B]|nr:class I SAM-dependent methyltransferase [Nocardioides sp. HDW12B]